MTIALHALYFLAGIGLVRSCLLEVLRASLQVTFKESEFSFSTGDDAGYVGFPAQVLVDVHTQVCCVCYSLQLDFLHCVRDGDIVLLLSFCLYVENIALSGVELHTPGISPAREGEEVFLQEAVVIRGGDGTVEDSIISKKSYRGVQAKGDVIDEYQEQKRS